MRVLTAEDAESAEKRTEKIIANLSKANRSYSISGFARMTGGRGNLSSLRRDDGEGKPETGEEKGDTYRNHGYQPGDS